MQDICEIINDNLNSIFPDAHMPLSRSHVPAAQTTTALWEGAEPPRQYEGRIVTASVELRPADAATGVFTFGAAALERHTVGNFTLLVRAADKVAAAQRVAAALRSDRAKLNQYMDDGVGGGAVCENGGSESGLPQSAAAGAERGGGSGKRGRSGGKAAAGPRGE
jgi:hypothetical protein